MDRPSTAPGDGSWSSAGLHRPDAIRAWQDWAARTIAPIDVSVLAADRFAARWRSRRLGPLSLLELAAPAQRVVHRDTGGAGQAAPSIQLVYVRRGAVRTEIGRHAFTVRPGEFVLFDNMRFYRMEMDRPHHALDIIMPRSWLEQWLPDPEPVLARPVSARAAWGRPLGSLMEAMAGDIDRSPLSRPMLAEQVGALLRLATGPGGVAADGHRDELVRRILAHVEEDFADAELGVERVCRALGISRRYLHALLAARGTSFGRALTARRLDHAAALLAAPRGGTQPIGETAFRCGFLDAGYFARQFRKRFGAAPSDWRRGATRAG